MHILVENLVKFYQFVIKILDRPNDGQPKSIIAPLFQSGALITIWALLRKNLTLLHTNNKCTDQTALVK